MSQQETTDVRVALNKRVQICELPDGEIHDYTIVESDRSNPEKGAISVKSPLAKALLGKQVGEQVTVVVGEDSVRYKILSIS